MMWTAHLLQIHYETGLKERSPEFIRHTLPPTLLSGLAEIFAEDNVSKVASFNSLHSRPD